MLGEPPPLLGEIVDCRPRGAVRDAPPVWNEERLPGRMAGETARREPLIRENRRHLLVQRAESLTTRRFELGDRRRRERYQSPYDCHDIDGRSRLTHHRVRGDDQEVSPGSDELRGSERLRQSAPGILTERRDGSLEPTAREEPGVGGEQATQRRRRLRDRSTLERREAVSDGLLDLGRQAVPRRAREGELHWLSKLSRVGRAGDSVAVRGIHEAIELR